MSFLGPHCSSAPMHSLPVFIITWVVARLATFLKPVKGIGGSAIRKSAKVCLEWRVTLPAHDIFGSVFPFSVESEKS